MKQIKQIMILDDDGTNNFVTERLLIDYNQDYEIISFTDPVAALDNLIKKDIKGKLLPDIIFLDINMPKLDGFEFLDELEKNDLSNKLQVIMYTSSTSPIDLTKSKNYKNVIGYMEKPFSIQAYGRMLDLSMR